MSIELKFLISKMFKILKNVRREDSVLRKCGQDFNGQERTKTVRTILYALLGDQRPSVEHGTYHDPCSRGLQSPQT